MKAVMDWIISNGYLWGLKVVEHQTVLIMKPEIKITVTKLRKLCQDSGLRPRRTQTLSLFPNLQHQANNVSYLTFHASTVENFMMAAIEILIAPI